MAGAAARPAVATASAQDPVLRSVLDEAVRLELADDFDEFLRYQRGDEDAEWADASLTSRGAIRLTADEVREFFDAYIALLNRYRQRPEVPAGARTVATRLLVFPLPDPSTGASPVRPAETRPERARTQDQIEGIHERNGPDRRSRPTPSG